MAVTCGDFDLAHVLKKECEAKKIEIPAYLKRYINLKNVFQYSFLNDSIDGGNEVYISMKRMLNDLGLNMEGLHHKGADDVKNLAKIILKMRERGVKFTHNFVKPV